MYDIAISTTSATTNLRQHPPFKCNSDGKYTDNNSEISESQLIDITSKLEVAIYDQLAKPIFQPQWSNRTTRWP